MLFGSIPTQPGSTQIQQNLEDHLRNRRVFLTKELENINKALELLEENPKFKELMNTLTNIKLY